MSDVLPDKISIQDAFAVTINLFKECQAERDQLRAQLAAALAERDEFKNKSEIWGQQANGLDQIVDKLTAENEELNSHIYDMTKNCISLLLHESRVKELEDQNQRLRSLVEKAGELEDSLDMSIRHDGCACDIESVDGHHLYVCHKHQALGKWQAAKKEAGV